MIKIHHLKVTAVNTVKIIRPGLSRSQILKALSKSLNYKSIGHLVKSYEIDAKGYFKHKVGPDLDINPYDISFHGIIFNEYALKVHLNISDEQAVRLKQLLDKPRVLKGYFGGNTDHSDLTLVKIGLDKMINGETGRLMACWPFEFYCRREKKRLMIIDTKMQIKSFIWFDGFYAAEEKYFKDQKSLNRYVEKLLGLFLKFDNVVFLKNVVEVLKEDQPKLFSFILDNFDHKFIKAPNIKFGEDILMFPCHKNGLNIFHSEISLN